MKFTNIKFIATDDFSKYLLANGWVVVAHFEGKARLWESKTSEEYEILQPINTSASDFTKRVRGLVEVLSKANNKSTDQVIQEINEICDDIIRIRVIHTDVNDGSIPFNEGVELFIKAKELLSSVARSLISPKKQLYSGKAPKIVNDYFDNLRLSQTEIGSYVLKIESPIFGHAAEKEQEDHCEEPFGRSVSNRLIHSISKLNSSIELYNDTKNFKYFEEVVRAGVGASLCSALIGLSGKEKKRTVEISLQPSPYADLSNSSLRSVTLDSEHIALVEKAMGYYLGEYTIPFYSLIGKVTKLARELDYGDGVVTISEQKNSQAGKKKHIEVTLPETLYNDAIQAHRKSLNMRLNGTLLVSGRKSYLTDVTSESDNPHLI